jgi:hypothetical protein
MVVLRDVMISVDSVFSFEIDERIIDKITDQLATWEEENGIISDLEALVVTEIRENLLGMTEEMQQIEQQMVSFFS